MRRNSLKLGIKCKLPQADTFGKQGKCPQMKLAPYGNAILVSGEFKQGFFKADVSRTARLQECPLRQQFQRFWDEIFEKFPYQLFAFQPELFRYLAQWQAPPLPKMFEWRFSARHEASLATTISVTPK